MKTTHTPGPWRVSGPSRGGIAIDDGGDYAIIADGQVIAEAICKTARDTYQPALENARLIAASPDLLDALEALQAKCVLYGGPHGGKMDLSQSRDAIAKAKGK